MSVQNRLLVPPNGIIQVRLMPTTGTDRAATSLLSRFSKTAAAVSEPHLDPAKAQAELLIQRMPLAEVAFKLGCGYSGHGRSPASSHEVSTTGPS